MISINIGTASAVLSAKKDGGLHHRPAGTAEVMAILEDASKFSTELLPANTRYYRKTNHQIDLAVEWPKHRRTILVVHGGSKTIENVALPAGVMFLKFNTDSTYGHSFSNALLFAFKGNTIRDKNEPLFRYPVPNCGYNGSICWSNAVKEYKSKNVSGFEGMIRAFFTSNFNNHMIESDATSYRSKDCSSPVDVDRYFAALAKEPEFKDEWLARGGYHTFLTALRSMVPGAEL